MSGNVRSTGGKGRRPIFGPVAQLVSDVRVFTHRFDLWTYTRPIIAVALLVLAGCAAQPKTAPVASPCGADDCGKRP